MTLLLATALIFALNASAAARSSERIARSAAMAAEATELAASLPRLSLATARAAMQLHDDPSSRSALAAAIDSMTASASDSIGTVRDVLAHSERNAVVAARDGTWLLSSTPPHLRRIDSDSTVTAASVSAGRILLGTEDGAVRENARELFRVDGQLTALAEGGSGMIYAGSADGTLHRHTSAGLERFADVATPIERILANLAAGHVAVLAGGEIAVFDEGGTEQARFTTDPASPAALAATPDGQTVIAAVPPTSDRGLSAMRLHSLRDHRFALASGFTDRFANVFTGVGQPHAAVWATYGGMLYLWEASQDRLTPLQGHSSVPLSGALGSETLGAIHRTVHVTGSAGREVLVWGPASTTPIARLIGPTAPVVWTGLGERSVAVLCSDGEFQIHRSRPRVSLMQSLGQRIVDASASPDGTAIAVVGRGAVHLISTIGERLRTWPVEETPTLVGWSADGQSLAIATANGGFRYATRDGNLGSRIADDHLVTALAPCGPTDIACGAVDGTVLRVAPGGTVQVFEPAGSPVVSIACRADGSQLASGSIDDSTRIWSKDGQARALDRNHGGRHVAISPRGDVLAMARGDGRVGLLRISTSAEPISFGVSESELTACRFRSDNELIVACLDGSIYRLRIGPALEVSLLARMPLHSAPVRTLALGPSGLVATASSDGSVALTRLESAGLVYQLPRRDHAARTLEFLPHGLLVAGRALRADAWPIDGAGLQALSRELSD